MGNTIPNIAGVKRRNLADEIQEILDSNSLPSYLANVIDAFSIIRIVERLWRV